MTPELQQECIRVMVRYYKLVVTAEQLEAVLAKDPEFRADLIAYSSPADTADREVLGDLFMKEIIGRPWPCYGDSQAYTDTFYADLRLLAPEKGYTFLG